MRTIKRVNAMPTVKNTDFDSAGDFSCFMSIHRKQGFPRFKLKQASTEPNIMRSVNDIKIRRFV